MRLTPTAEQLTYLESIGVGSGGASGAPVVAPKAEPPRRETAARTATGPSRPRQVKSRAAVKVSSAGVSGAPVVVAKPRTPPRSPVTPPARRTSMWWPALLAAAAAVVALLVYAAS